MGKKKEFRVEVIERRAVKVTYYVNATSIADAKKIIRAHGGIEAYSKCYPDRGRIVSFDSVDETEGE